MTERILAWRNFSNRKQQEVLLRTGAPEKLRRKRILRVGEKSKAPEGAFPVIRVIKS